jgi:hypothetical protein
MTLFSRAIWPIGRVLGRRNPNPISSHRAWSSFAVIADRKARDVVEALRAAGAHPIVEARWADASAVLQAHPPQAIVLAEPCPDHARASALAQALDAQAEQDGSLFVPVIVRIWDETPPWLSECLPQALAIAARTPAEQLVRRLTAALRIRTLHSAVIRRRRTFAAYGRDLPALSTADPLDEAIVLVAERGSSHQDLCTAPGERVGVIGALTAEEAARTLESHEVDGMIIGDGFDARAVETLLNILAEGSRFRDLPVAVTGGHSAVIEQFAAAVLPNLEHVGDGPKRVMAHLLPYIRLHAFARGLTSMLVSLNARGALDPNTGLLDSTIFWRDLNSAVDDAEKRGAALSIARFLLPVAERPTSLQAARLVGRQLRQADFACQQADQSILTVFTDTNLDGALVAVRRIASAFTNASFEPTVTLTALKPTDNVDSLVARLGEDSPNLVPRHSIP